MNRLNVLDFPGSGRSSTLVRSASGPLAASLWRDVDALGTVRQLFDLPGPSDAPVA